MNSLKTSLKFWRVMFQAKLRRDFESHRHNTYTRFVQLGDGPERYARYRRFGQCH